MPFKNPTHSFQDVVDNINSLTKLGTIKGSQDEYTFDEILRYIYLAEKTENPKLYQKITNSHNLRDNIKKFPVKASPENRYYDISKNHLWKQYDFQNLNLPEQGIKIHISAPEDYDELFMELITSYLISKRAFFKHVKNEEGWNGLSGTQKGKAFTIYTKDIDEALLIGEEMYQLINYLSEKGVNFVEIGNSTELKYRGSKYVTGRPSNYNGKKPFKINRVSYDDVFLRKNRNPQEIIMKELFEELNKKKSIDAKKDFNHYWGQH